jgi:hypothetical protein
VSFQYDQYLARHRANVKRGFDWLSENLPGLMTNTLTAGWNTEFAHDQSKNEPDEYEAYDAYFYGNNRSYEVVQRYQRAWLLHIHRNPHHWQHWILIHDDMEDGELETVLEEMADAYICLEFLKSIFNITPEELQKAMDVKLQREKNKQR